MPSTTLTRLQESTPFAAAAVPAEGPGRLRVRIINAGVGSSGAYPAETLQAAAAARVFPAGTHVYLDHPTESEAYERPERSVRDLAGALTTDAVYEDGALFAEVEVYSPWRKAIAEMADVIGMSIRAAAVVEEGEFEGRRLPIVKEITEGYSVDFVTRAGRGGRVVQVIESARAASRAVARGVAEATANDRREQLDGLVKDAHSDGDRWAWVRDFDDTTVWFEVDGTTYQQGYETTDDTATALTGERVEVTVRTEYVPVAAPADEATSVPTSPAGQSIATESREDTMATIAVEERELATLKADAGRAPVLESERDAAITRAEEAERKLAVSEARTKLRPTVAAVLNASESLPPVIRQRVADQVVEALASDATEATAKEAAEAARTNAEAEAAAIAEMYGVGQVRGNGTRATDDDKDDLSESELDAELAAISGRTVKEA